MIKRRDFIKATLAVSTFGATACGDDGGKDSKDTGSRDIGSGDTNTGDTGNIVCEPTIRITEAPNHGHVITVTNAEVNAGVDKTYDLSDNGDHAHTVMVTAADFAALKKDLTVTVESSTDSAHAHMVTISCATG